MEKSKNGCINKQRGVRNNSYQFEERKKCHARKRHRAYRHLETTELANDPCKGLRYDLPRENIANSSKIRSAAAGRLNLWHCQTSALHVEAPGLATPPPNWNATGTLKCVSIEGRRLHHFSMTMSARREKNLQELVGRKGAESCWSRSGFAGRLEQNTNTWNAPELQGSQPETL